MPGSQAVARAAIPGRQLLVSLLLAMGFLASMLLRLSVGGVSVAKSPVAGLAFGSCLMVLSFAAGLSTKFSGKSVFFGIFGGLALCGPAFFAHTSGALPGENYLNWAFIVGFVAIAEEAFFRGALFEAIQRWKGETPAILIAAIAFTALHIPLYGWHVVPLDFTVGIWLGSLRSISGAWLAPAISHTLADLAGWWLI
jgi:membrane protease YdiL (CAAX protease family)